LENAKDFYQKFFPLFWVIAGCTIPIAVAGGFIDFGFIPWKVFLLFLIVVVFDVAGTYMIIKMPVTVSSNGLKCIDWMWAYKFISWDNIRFVKPSRAFFGLPYLRIGLNGSKDVIWLPLLLNEFTEFIKLVVSYAGEDNLLSKDLKQYHSAK